MSDAIDKFISGYSMKTLCEAADPNPWVPENEIRAHIQSLQTELNTKLATVIEGLGIEHRTNEFEDWLVIGRKTIIEYHDNPELVNLVREFLSTKPQGDDECGGCGHIGCAGRCVSGGPDQVQGDEQ